MLAPSYDLQSGIRRRASAARFGPAVLRVAIGAVFVGSGLQKLLGISGGTGVGGTAALFQALQLRPAYPLAVFITGLELVGGALLIVGALTSWIAVLLIAEMVVAIVKVHLAHGFFINWTQRPGVGHGYEFNLVLVAALICLILEGPGALALETRYRHK